jgi:hypothetical protein
MYVRLRGSTKENKRLEIAGGARGEGSLEDRFRDAEGLRGRCPVVVRDFFSQKLGGLGDHSFRLWLCEGCRLVHELYRGARRQYRLEFENRRRNLSLLDGRYLDLWVRNLKNRHRCLLHADSSLDLSDSECGVGSRSHGGCDGSRDEIGCNFGGQFQHLRRRVLVCRAHVHSQVYDGSAQQKDDEVASIT